MRAEFGDAERTKDRVAAVVSTGELAGLSAALASKGYNGSGRIAWRNGHPPRGDLRHGIVEGAAEDLDEETSRPATLNHLLRRSSASKGSMRISRTSAMWEVALASPAKSSGATATHLASALATAS